MRKLITIVEAKSTQPRVRKSAYEVSVDLTSAASKIFSRPIDIDFLTTWGDSLKAHVIEAKRRYDEMDAEDRTHPFDAFEMAMDELPQIYKYGASNSFNLVPAAVKEETLAYQKHQGANLDDAAGYESDFNFIESSDWLDAMSLQTHTANKLKFARIDSIDDIAQIAEILNNFCDDWKNTYRTDQGQEATLVEEMTLGLQNIIPLLMFAVKLAVAKDRAA
jgi:hypothetical protein